MIRIVKGLAGDPVGLRTGCHGWQEQLAELPGWISTTAGVTDKGVFIAVVRFDSEASARTAPDAAWAEPAVKDGVTVDDYPGAEVYNAGESAAAGFVQTFEGWAKDMDRLRALQVELAPLIEETRPEETGDTLAWRDDGRFAFTGYYTSEHEARLAESNLTPDVQAGWAEMVGLIENLEFFDLSDPWVWVRGAPA